MLKRLLLAVALPVLAAAPVHAQTIFKASGGDVIFTPTFGINNIPFDFYLDAIGHPTRLVASENGTQFTLDTKGTVANVSLGSLGSLDLGPFAAGTALTFSLVSALGTDNVTAFYRRQNATSFFIQIVAGSGKLFATDPAIGFTISGISSLENAGCSLAQVGPPAIDCSNVDPTIPVTGTPEPGTIALFATGLAGLIPVAIRRRRAA